jgi:putative transposase
MFAGEMRRMRIDPMCAYSNWKRHLDEVLVKINGEAHYLWPAVDEVGRCWTPLSPSAAPLAAVQKS